VLHQSKPLAHQLAGRQQLEGRDYSPPSSTCENTPGVPSPVMGSSVQERHGHSRTSPVEATKMIAGLKQMCEERLRELVCSGWRRQRADLTAVYKYLI